MSKSCKLDTDESVYDDVWHTVLRFSKQKLYYYVFVQVSKQWKRVVEAELSFSAVRTRWTARTVKKALAKKNVPYVEYLVQHGCPVDSSSYAHLVKLGSLSCLKVVNRSNSLICARELCMYAARYGQLACLQYLHTTGHDWGSRACANAAANGHLHCLQYLHEHNCPWDRDTTTLASAHGHLSCLEYAHKNGCPMPYKPYVRVVNHGHLDCLKYLHASGFSWDKFSCAFAAENGHLQCLQYLHIHGCRWDSLTCSWAAENDQLECLQYAHENGCPWNADVLVVALRNQSWKCLKYAYEQGCECSPHMYAQVENKVLLSYYPCFFLCLPQALCKYVTCTCSCKK